MKKTLLRTALILAFAALLAPAQSFAQRYLTERLGIANEARAIAQFGENLAVFAKKSDLLLKKTTLTQAEVTDLESEGKKITDGTSNFQTNLRQLITKLKDSNNWNEQLDADFLASVKSANARTALQQAGGARKLLEAALSDVNTARDVVNTNVNETKAKLAATQRTETAEVFAAHAFKKGFKCFLLGAGLAVSEAAGLDRTACRLDEAFGEAGCGGKKPCTS